MTKRIIKIVCWTLMAAVLFVVGTLVCTVKLLHPERLTPIVVRLANQNLNADVSISKVELSLRESFPFMTVDVTDLIIEARDLNKLSEDDRLMLPEYADTLLALKQLRGSLNIMKVAAGEIELGDVVITHPEINLVVAGDSLNNFNIIPPSTEPTKPFDLTKLSIRRFAMVDPGPIRYYNAIEGTDLAVDMTSAELVGSKHPRYSLGVKGQVPLPMLEGFFIDRIPFDVNGDLIWDAAHPEALGLENFKFSIAFLSGNFNARMTFGDNLVINSLDLNLNPIPLGEILAHVPSETLESFDLPSDIATNIAPEISIKLNQPYDTGIEELPYATIDVNIAPCELTYDRVHLTNLSADISAQLQGSDLDQATVTINDLSISGPATDITVKGRVTNLAGDPLISGELTGHTDIEKLPPIIANLLKGYISGNVTAQLNFTGRPSMFAPGSYYKLSVKGDITGRNLYYLSNDTVNMVYISEAKIKFGNTDTYHSKTSGVDIKLLGVSIDVDSVNVLHTQYSFTGKGLHLGLATKNQKRTPDTTALVPFGGGVRIDAFNFTLLSDTIRVRARDIDGNVILRGTDGDFHRPNFDLNLDMKRLSAGVPGTQFLLRDAHVQFAAQKLPVHQSAARIRQLADSITQIHPDLSPDSVYAIAMEKYRHHRRSGPPRVHAQYQAGAADEIIDWGTSRDLNRFLRTWQFNGRVVSNRVGLFTPYFPIRNRISNFNVAFNNDTIRLDNVMYKAGHSDFMISGQVTNLRRGLTSKSHTQSLKINFDISSDSIDINQLADLTFKGAAYHESKNKKFKLSELADSNDDALDAIIDRYVTDVPDTLAPLLIPRNIEASLKMHAKNVLYSDLLLHDYSGEVLIYNGALNLHGLKASSSIGTVELSALYNAPNINELDFGFGLNVHRFDIQGFLHMVPAIDSVMPLMRDFGGIINSSIAATVKLDHNMNFEMPSLRAAINIEGDSLVLIDEKTYKTIGKWLRFKDKNHNMINHMSVEMMVDSSMIHIYPFVFDIDRYRLGVQGYNDLDMNFNYHIAVLKSPIPFKFGINISGNPEKYKVRFGGAKFNEQQAVKSVPFADTTRVNLIHQIENVFRRGIDDARFGRLKINTRQHASDIDLSADTLTHADSLRLMEEGIIQAADTVPGTPTVSTQSKLNRSEIIHGLFASIHQLYATLPSRRNAQGRPAGYGRHTV